MKIIFWFWHKKFGTGTICKSVFGMAQKIWTSPKCFGTRKRTRHKLLKTKTVDFSINNK